MEREAMSRTLKDFLREFDEWIVIAGYDERELPARTCGRCANWTRYMSTDNEWARKEIIRAKEMDEKMEKYQPGALSDHCRSVVGDAMRRVSSPHGMCGRFPCLGNMAATDSCRRFEEKEQAA
jgi:hypothetical protein